MRQTGSLTYKHVNALSRGLDVLRALNGAKNGRSHPNLISKELGMNRTTVRRVLETLKAEGYVNQCEQDSCFYLAPSVRRLSDGFAANDAISEVAAPILRQLCKDIVWPCDFATAEGDTMVIRESTQKYSTLSFKRAVAGDKRPMLTTALGRAFLSFCPEPERNILVRLLYAQYGSSVSEGRYTAAVDRLIESTRDRGYAVNFGEWPEDRRIAAIAVPIYGVNEEVLGTVNVISITRAMAAQNLAEQFLAPLKIAAADIRRGLAFG